MMRELTVGDHAPNFDLTSTEGVVLMLRDEVPRTQVLLYFFDQVAEAAPTLEALARSAGELAGSGIKIMAVSEASLDELTAAQQQQELPFPLLHDDRGFSKVYAGSGDTATFVLVDRDQRVAWIERGRNDLAGSLGSLAGDHATVRQSTANYPKSVINSLVDRWVN